MQTKPHAVWVSVPGRSSKLQKQSNAFNSPAALQRSCIVGSGPSLPFCIKLATYSYPPTFYKNMSFFEFSASDLDSLAKLLTPPAEVLHVQLCCC